MSFACSEDPQSRIDSLPNLTPQEAQEDLAEIAHKFRNFYGPLQFKERRFGFDFDEWVNATNLKLQDQKTDAEIMGIFREFLAKLDDAHVGLKIPATSSEIANYKIPMEILPLEDKFYVEQILDEDVRSLGIKEGDEILAMDDKSMPELLEIVKRYKWLGNDVSERHLSSSLTTRSYELTDLVPKNADVKLTLKNAEGKIYTTNLAWRISKLPDTSIPRPTQFRQLSVESELAFIEKMGTPQPFFINDASAEALSIRRIAVTDPAIATKYGIDLNSKPEIYAGIYNYNDKNVLLVRQPTYGTEDFQTHLKYYRGLLAQYQPLVDVLVVDQTNNPGGDLMYVLDFFSLFIQEPKANFVQFLRADRKWYNEFRNVALETDPELQTEVSKQMMNTAVAVEDALKEDLFLTRQPASFTGSDLVYPDKEFTWTKPVMVLINELDGSGGDAFPMLMQRNGVSKLFGERTMGAGGSVEVFGPVTHSNIEVKITRGLFTSYKEDGVYAEEDLIENNGVLPDFHHSLSLEDFHSKYVTYIKRFSEEATSL